MASRKGSTAEGTVRLQWDPHHDLDGTPTPLRRAIQLGLKGIKGFSSGEDILAISDLTPFVSTKNHITGPKEVLYPISDELKKILDVPIDKEGSQDSDEA